MVWSPRNSQVPSPHPFWTFTPYLACDFHLFKRLLARISVFLLLPPFKATSCFSGARTARTRHSTREVSSWPAILAHHLIGVPSCLVAPLPWSWWEEFYEIWDSNYVLSHLKGVTSTHSLHPWTDSTRNQVHTKNTLRLETGHPPAVTSIVFGLSCTEHIRTLTLVFTGLNLTPHHDCKAGFLACCPVWAVRHMSEAFGDLILSHSRSPEFTNSESQLPKRLLGLSPEMWVSMSAMPF